MTLLAPWALGFFVVAAGVVALYLLDRSRRKQRVATLRFWVTAEQPTVVSPRKKIQQPLSLLLQLVSICLLLLAIAQLRLGSQGATPFDHVLILETSAWMGARSGAPRPRRTSPAPSTSSALPTISPSGCSMLVSR